MEKITVTLTRFTRSRSNTKQGGALDWTAFPFDGGEFGNYHDGLFLGLRISLYSHNPLDLDVYYRQGDHSRSLHWASRQGCNEYRQR